MVAPKEDTHLEWNAQGLSLAQTLDCGQCFRWQPQPDGSWTGIVEGRAVQVRETAGDRLEITGLAGPDPAAEPEFWAGYFALDLDYPRLLEQMRAAHPGLAGCIDCAPGIRVLRQPFFETLITFLISQNNNIPRIKGIVDRLCRGLGEPLDDSGERYAFPTAQRLAPLAEEDLAFLRAGWRSGYILDAARRVAAGDLTEAQLRALPLAEAKAKLMEVRGVGPKVADCVLLYGLGRWEAYPIDVWIRRADQTLFTARVKDPAAYLNRKTGGYAGIAQQYIFAWARTTGLTKKTHKNRACD
ncbi:hypothetical protein B5E67_05200 [Faecalibacterium sp. An122]|nr:hypothetical protein B5E67_05200 [Faecalibacterium sp. An122]